MGYDKVVDSSVLDAGLKQIADAIREKGGNSDNLAFPTAMAEAIAAIEAGGLFGDMYCVSGSYTPAEAQTSPVSVHKFENLNTSTSSGVNEVKGQSVAVIYAHIPDDSYTPSYPLVWFSGFFNNKYIVLHRKSASSNNSTVIKSALFGTSSISVTIGCSSEYPLPAGQEYRWFALIPNKYIKS